MVKKLQPAGHVLISRERMRQVSNENWSPEHDDTHSQQELLRAAICYARGAKLTEWPWNSRWWKPSPDPIRNLVKAGALIAAEIDRLQRAKNRASGPVLGRSMGMLIIDDPVKPPGINSFSERDAQAIAKLMAESLGKAIQQMTAVLNGIKWADIDRALGKDNGSKKKKKSEKPAAKKPGQGSRAKRQAAVPGKRGKRNRQGGSTANRKAGRRRG